MISRLKYPLLAPLLLLLLFLTSNLVSARPLNAIALLEGRTYDQAHDTGYIDWNGTVQYINLIHKDGTSLPPDEGGTYCGAGCLEEVTRISNGGKVSGSFGRNTTYFEVMVAFSHDFNVGDAVLSACSATMTYTLYAGPGFSLPGFVSMPMNMPAGCRTWTLTASGGYVDFRSVDVYYVAAPPTATATRTFTPTLTAVFTSTATRTSVPSATYTASSTATRTPTSTGTNTPTYTPPPTATYTAVSTFTFTPTNTSTATATQTVTPSRTPTSTATYTLTPSPTSTSTSTATATHTATPSRTPTSTAPWTFTPSPTNTATRTPLPTSTQTATFTATATYTSTPSRTPTFTPSNTASPTALPLPPTVSLTEHWWIWESGILHVTPKTYPIASVKLTVSDPQNRWRAVILRYDPRKVPELVFWDRRFAEGTLAPSGEYPVQVRVCDDHNLCASAAGRISVPDGIWPTITPTFVPTTTSTVLPSATPTRTRIPASPTPVLIIPSPTPSTPTPHPTPWPFWQMLGLVGLMIVIASASVVDPRPKALRRLGEVMEQLSNHVQLDSSHDEK